MAREEAAAARGEAAFAGLVWEEVDGDAADGGAVGEGSPQGLDRPVPAGLGRPHPDRARQFSPLAARRGYYERAHERERVIEPRRPLSEEEARALDATIADLQRGAMVRAVFYEKEAYRTIVGTVSQVDMIYHDLWIVRERIPFDELCALEALP